MIFRLSFILFFFNLSLASSQDQLQIDSIQKLIVDYDAKKDNPDQSVPGDTLKIDWLLNLSGLYVNYHPDKALIFAQDAERISRKINDSLRLSTCYGSYARCNYIEGLIDSAISYFNKELEVLNSLERIGDTSKIVSQNIFTATTNLGTMYIRQGDQVKALQYFIAGLKLIETKHDTFSIAYSYSNIAWMYKSIENYDKSKEYYKKALRLFHLLYNEAFITSCLSGLGNIEQALGHNQTAEIYYKSIIDLNPESGHNYAYQHALVGMAEISNSRGETYEALRYYRLQLNSNLKSGGSGSGSTALLNIGDTYVTLGKMDSALILMAQAIDTCRKYDIKNGISGALISMGSVYQKMGIYATAQKCILEGLELAKDIKELYLIKTAYQELVPVYVATKDFKRAYEYNVLLKEVNDSIFTLSKANKITQLSMQYEIDQSEQDHESELDKKEIIQQAELSQQKQQKKFYIAGGVFLFLLTGGLVNRLVYSSKTKRLLEEKNVQIEKEKLRAEQSERFKQQFLANMSHEIRTPMNAVMGMTHLLMQKDPRKDQFPYLVGMKNSSDNLLHIINDILDLAKIEAGKMELENIDFSMTEVVLQVEQLLKDKANEKGLHWIVEIDPNIPVLLGDPIRIYQVLLNLTSNAIKFTDKGSVHIVIQTIPSDQADLIPIQFSVIDTGIGIAKDKLDLVFDDFQQANTSDSRQYGGTGLGLSISKQLIELLGGKISIESEENSGTTFSFKLHFQEGSVERLRQRNSPEAEVNGSILNGLKILVADDNAYNLIVAGDTLKLNADVSIRTATTGKEVISLLQENDFDVILMDVQMPEWNGFEATQYIRTHFDSPKKDIPIIAFTASVLRTDLDKCRQAGMNSYIAKPFTATQLINGIAEVLNK